MHCYVQEKNFNDENYTLKSEILANKQIDKIAYMCPVICAVKQWLCLWSHPLLQKHEIGIIFWTYTPALKKNCKNLFGKKNFLQSATLAILFTLIVSKTGMNKTFICNKYGSIFWCQNIGIN